MLQIPAIVTIAKHYVFDQQHHHRWQWTADCLITTFNSPFIVIHPSRWSLQFHTNSIIITSDQERDRSFQQTPPVAYQAVYALPAWYIRQHDNHDDPDNKRRWMTNSLGLPRTDGQKAAAYNWYSYWCSSLTNDLTAGCRPSYKTISSDREWLLNMCFLIIYAFVLQLNRQQFFFFV